MLSCACPPTPTGMWLDVADTAHEEHDYFSLLLTLLSSLTQVMDLQLEGKGHGVVAPCKHMFQNMLKVSLWMMIEFWVFFIFTNNYILFICEIFSLYCYLGQSSCELLYSTLHIMLLVKCLWIINRRRNTGGGGHTNYFSWPCPLFGHTN